MASASYYGQSENQEPALNEKSSYQQYGQQNGTQRLAENGSLGHSPTHNLVTQNHQYESGDKQMNGYTEQSGNRSYPQEQQDRMETNHPQYGGYQNQQYGNQSQGNQQVQEGGYQNQQYNNQVQGSQQGQGRMQPEQGGYQGHSGAQQQQYGQTNGGAADTPEQQDMMTKILIRLEKKFGGERFTNPDNDVKNKAMNANIVKKLTYALKLVMQKAPGYAMRYLR